MGGIATGRDALEFMLAGAAAVQVGTTTFWDPTAPARLVGEIETWCCDHHVERVRDLVGRLEV